MGGVGNASSRQLRTRCAHRFYGDFSNRRRYHGQAPRGVCTDASARAIVVPTAEPVAGDARPSTSPIRGGLTGGCHSRYDESGLRRLLDVPRTRSRRSVLRRARRGASRSSTVWRSRRHRQRVSAWHDADAPVPTSPQQRSRRAQELRPSAMTALRGEPGTTARIRRRDRRGHAASWWATLAEGVASTSPRQVAFASRACGLCIHSGSGLTLADTDLRHVDPRPARTVMTNSFKWAH